MCEGVCFMHGDEVMRVFYINPKALLPVLMQDGSIRLMPWGRRRKQTGQLPATGWARLDAIYSGRWDKFFPKPVKIPVLSFMDRDIEGQRRWYDLQKGQFIQGLIARDGHEKRVYIVIIEPEVEDAELHHRWPRVVQRGEKSRYSFE